MYFICANYSTSKYQSDYSPLCWYNIPAYYAGMFDVSLPQPLANVFRDMSEVKNTMNFIAEDQKYEPCLPDTSKDTTALTYNHVTHDSINKHATLQLQSL